VPTPSDTDDVNWNHVVRNAEQLSVSF